MPSSIGSRLPGAMDYTIDVGPTAIVWYTEVGLLSRLRWVAVGQRLSMHGHGNMLVLLGVCLGQ